MNKRQPKWITLASSVAISLVLGIFAAGCSGADPSSSNELTRPAPSATVTAQATTPLPNPCLKLCESCTGEDDTECNCACARCHGEPLPIACRPHFQ
jgi:hypothetical protein